MSIKTKLSPKTKRLLRVGFDLDGVLLYNPARIFRPVIVSIKKIYFPKEKDKFHLPKTNFQELVWWFLHKSSFMKAPGIERIEHLIKNKKIKAYIVSARYESLKSDFDSWIKKIGAQKYYSGIFYNNNNEQPHIFKEKEIKRLNLDIFVEDNWDIVRHLSKKTKAKIFWIYNFLDRGIKYNYKFPTLIKVLDEVKKSWT